MPQGCVVLEDTDGRPLSVCTAVGNDTVSVRAAAFGSPQATKEMQLKTRISTSCPPRPLRRYGGARPA
jgi:hypothetical protein